ncbi:S-layer homology domain-containing protein [Paenibacillus glufosinatiresistens]|uniref:S-layer homology domain-containing protein n=1 Tax=Paenibacillus glufosinatiresistens TaxID=3070657 RepID=UPI00286E35B3|nr:S-layer homology domain-containing protein [Paenibacillus sp. YX.27]
MKASKFIISLTIAATLMGTASAYAASFKDVKESHWAYSAVEWGVNKGITTGYANSTFKPNDSVTSEEFLSMLIRSYKGKLVADAGQRWSAPYYTVAKQYNYPVGTSRSAKITRAQVAELIAGTQGKHYEGANAIRYMLASGLASGKSSNTVYGYQGGDTLTRAEAVVFIKNVLDKTNGADLQNRPTTESDASTLPGGSQGSVAVIDGYDARLQGWADKMLAAVSDLGFGAGYNKGQGRTFLRTEDGIIFMSYSDNTASGGTQVISMSGMLSSNNNDSVDQAQLQAVLAAMDALGLPSGPSVEKTIDWTLSPAGDTKTLQVENKTLEFISTGYGRMIIYVD